MENENLDLEIKPTGNKDLWLFLIIVDIIFLCVFGFFLYKHFSARLFDAPANVASSVEQTETVEVPEISETDIVVGEEAIAVESVAAAPASDAAAEKAVKPEPVKPQEVKPAEEKPVVEDKKESVIVKVNPKFFRPAEVDILLGDPTKAETKLGWKRKINFKELVTRMVNNDMALVEKEIKISSLD